MAAGRRFKQQSQEQWDRLMLILSRKPGESICMPGTNTTITIHRTTGGRVLLAIDAPREVVILRGELMRFDDALPQPDDTDLPLTAISRPR